MTPDRSPNRPAVPWHRRLEAHSLVYTTLVAGVSMIAALVGVDRMVTSHSIRRSSENLRAAQAVFYRLARQRADFALSQCRLVVELPVFRASVDTGDRATVTQMAQDYCRSLGAGFCIVTDGRGRWLGQPGWPVNLPPPAGLRQAIDAARAGRPHQAHIGVNEKLLLAVSQPAPFGQEILGTLTLGYWLDDVVAAELARTTGCEVTFVYEQRICGTSLPAPARRALEAALATGGEFGGLGDAPAVQTVGGARYVGGTYALAPHVDGGDAGRLILLQAWAPTQSFLDEVMAALFGVLAVTLALALGGGLVFSRRMTRPLRRMVTVAEDVAAGNWDRRAPEAGSAEVVVMAAAFNHMTDNLRHWYREAQSQAQRLAETLEELRQAHGATLLALSRALDARDNETEGHSLRVTHYAVRLGEQLGLDPDTLMALRWGALLHDIGKIGVPDAILLKPGRLTPDEMEAMRHHCEHGLRIVRDIPFLQCALGVIGCHHERYDGRGYPRGLAGAAIPLAARIFAVADTLDAMTSDRPYRRRGSFTGALAEIRAASGSQFDPAVVAALGAILEELRGWREQEQLSAPGHCRGIGEPGDEPDGGSVSRRDPVSARSR